MRKVIVRSLNLMNCFTTLGKSLLSFSCNNSSSMFWNFSFRDACVYVLRYSVVSEPLQPCGL